jgi:hypothetical protein
MLPWRQAVKDFRIKRWWHKPLNWTRPGEWDWVPGHLIGYCLMLFAFYLIKVLITLVKGHNGN